ncbi:hypothetical protein HOY80DRAFT_750378 [Tuber brumale]|nr:hypothetical protein HOY80DRAFT_750378 [Tuber brumale]
MNRPTMELILARTILVTPYGASILGGGGREQAPSKAPGVPRAAGACGTARVWREGKFFFFLFFFLFLSCFSFQDLPYSSTGRSMWSSKLPKVHGNKPAHQQAIPDPPQKELDWLKEQKKSEVGKRRQGMHGALLVKRKRRLFFFSAPTIHTQVPAHAGSVVDCPLVRRFRLEMQIGFSYN